jgi:hypothetical protein
VLEEVPLNQSAIESFVQNVLASSLRSPRNSLVSTIRERFLPRYTATILRCVGDVIDANNECLLVAFIILYHLTRNHVLIRYWQYLSMIFNLSKTVGRVELSIAACSGFHSSFGNQIEGTLMTQICFY